MDNHLEDQEQDALEAPAHQVVGEDVKTIHLRGIVGFLDGPVYNFDNALLQCDDMVPVFSADEQTRIGFCVLTRILAPGIPRLEAEIFINYATEERLLIETGERFYAAMHWLAVKNTDAIKGLQDPVPLSTIEVYGLVISRTKPADWRLSKLEVIQGVEK